MMDEKKKKYGLVPIPEFSDIFADPFSLFRKSQIDEFFNEGFAVPRIDLQDNGDSFRVNAEMPGLEKKDIKLKVTADEVIIKAERYVENEESGKNFYRKERSSSGYYRTLRLPESVVADSSKASYKNGILSIDIKKAKDNV
ncbi:MAG: Hsp20/alpha crystallin family protein [Candidatus Marsarchaeota archaeon]|nr:Hsp20/alpha crystallin family protein [Candidatus Marsarchaeota archaeon]